MKKWYQIQAKKNKTAEILIYEQIGEDFWGEGVSAKEFVKDLQALDIDNIDLHINSPGGNVFDGNAIYNALKSHRANIRVVVDGIAASVASVVAMSGDTVEMPENAMMMIHDPSGFVMGTAGDMEKMANALNKIKGGLVTAYHNKSDLDNDQISEMMTDETWMTAEEALEYGFADEITEKVNIQANFEGLSQYKNVPNRLLASLSDTDDGRQTINKTKKKEGKIMSKDGIVPATIAELTSMYPDLVAQIREQGAKSVNADELVSTAKTEERDRVLGLAAIQFGAEEGEKFKSVVDSGVTVDQFTAIRAVGPVKAKDTTKEDLLEAIQDAGAQNAGAGGADMGTNDFMALVDAYQVERKCGKVTAMQAVMKKHPEAHRTYIKNSQTVH